MPTYTGTNGAETITGSATDDFIDGHRGNDQLFGLEGADNFLYRTGGGFIADHTDGSDTIDGGAGVDRFEVDGSVRLAYETSTGRYVDYPLYVLSAGPGGVAQFVLSQETTVDGGYLSTATQVVSLIGVETIAFNFTHDPAPPTAIGPTGDTFYYYTTSDVLTIGELTGTGVTGRIDFDGGSGSDWLIASAAVNEFLARGGTGGDRLTTGSADDLLYGEDHDDILSGGAGTNLLDGGAGADTADYSTAGQAVHIDLNAGGVFNNGFGGQDTLTSIENLVGSAFNDVLIGEGSANWLTGGAGSDYLIGLGGDDRLDGGAGALNALQGGLGNDIYIVSNAGDTLTEFAGEGVDAVQTALQTYTLRANFETLTYTGAGGFTGTGNAEANAIYGGGLVDSLYGMAGDDLLMGGAGSDVLYGGAGNDVLNGGAANGDTASYQLAASGVFVTLDQATPQATNDGDGGVDTLIGIENLTGSAFNDVLIGDGAANILTGGTGSDVLIGLAGNDVLIGGTGAANQMQGGLGDDRYLVSTVGDTLIENVGQGLDRVEVTLQTYTLKANFEFLVFVGVGAFVGTGHAGDDNIIGGASGDTLSGLDGEDVLVGNGGADLLIGGNGTDRAFGGDGNDVLRGGVGNDILVGEADFDTVDYSTAAAGVTVRLMTQVASNDGDGGADTLESIEAAIGSAFNDTLLGDNGQNHLSGGAGSDLLLGYAGNDVLNGGTGAANQMQGGQGDDTYVVAVAGDTLVEAAGEGQDTVQTALAAYALRDHFEALVFTGAGAFAGTGNNAANALTGGAGADTLTGRGGDDVLTGGLGTDTAVMSGVQADYAIAAGAGFFTITDSVAGRDGIDTLFGVERVRFSDGTVLVLGASPAPAAALASALEALDQAASGLAARTDDIALTLPNGWDGY